MNGWAGREKRMCGRLKMLRHDGADFSGVSSENKPRLFALCRIDWNARFGLFDSYFMRYARVI